MFPVRRGFAAPPPPDGGHSLPTPTVALHCTAALRAALCRYAALRRSAVPLRGTGYLVPLRGTKWSATLGCDAVPLRGTATSLVLLDLAFDCVLIADSDSNWWVC